MTTPTSKTVAVPIKLWESISFLIHGIAILGGWMKQCGHGALYESAVAIAKQIDKLEE